jgi:hypothetical protein
MNFEEKTFVIAAAQGIQNPSNANSHGRNSKAGKPHKPLINAMDQFIENENAESFILALPGANVGEKELDEYFREERDDLYMDTSAQKRLYAERRKENIRRINNNNNMHWFWDDIPTYKYPTLNSKKLNSKIGIIEPKVPPQNEDPITGNQDLPRDYFGRSVVMAHSKQRFKSIPKDHAGRHPRILMTTGGITHPSYNETNSRGSKAARHHQYGFAVVDVLSPTLYLPRLVPARKDGTFVDLGNKYSPGKDPEYVKTKALILGDLHHPFEDEISMQASFEQIDELKPEQVFAHDFIDFYSIAHHNLDDDVWQMWLAEKGSEKIGDADSLESELEYGYSKLVEMAERVGSGTLYVVPSNHDNFVHKWLAKGEYRKDRKNMRMGAKIVSDYKMDDSPLEIGLRQIGKIPDNVNFLSIMDDMRPWGYQCSAHGDLGINGARGGIKGFALSYGKGIMGHSHQLEILGNAISVGTNSEIPLDYQKGRPSTSMHGNAVIYDGGLAQAIPIINGRWRK